MKILRFLVGIPASGKSTLRKELVSLGYSYTNKDEIRKGMAKSLNIKEHKVDEKNVIQEEMNQLTSFMLQGHNIVCDNTHVTERHFNRVEQLCKQHGYVFEPVYLTDSFNVPKCHERNLKRAEQVPVNVIEDMAEMFCNVYFKRKLLPELNINKVDNKKAVVFDIDGTLAITTNRSAFEWDKVCNDKVNHKVAELVEYYKDKGCTIIVLSGRDSVCRDLTIKWLNDNGIYFDELYMRTKNDYRRDVIVKMELYAQYVYPNYNVELVYDDRAQVTTLWRGLGLTCFQVASGRF